MTFLFSLIFAMFALFLNLDWLTLHREARSRVDEEKRLKDEADEKSRNEAQEAGRRKRQLDLQRVLTALGIDVTLEQITWTGFTAISRLDDYEFLCDGVESRSVGMLPTPKQENEATKELRFRLTIRKQACEAHPKYEWFKHQYAAQDRAFCLLAGMATDHDLAWVARAIELVDAEIPKLQAVREQEIAKRVVQDEQEREYMEERAKQVETPAEKPEPPTLANRLLDVLHEVIAEHIN